MGTCNLILSSTFRPQYDGYYIPNVEVIVLCDGDYLTSLKEGEVKKITIESGSHIFQFEADFWLIEKGVEEGVHESASFRDSKIIDLPSERQYALLEENLMMQFEKWRDKREKDSEEFLREMGEIAERDAKLIGDYYKKMYHK